MTKWRVTNWSGGEGYKAGYYLFRPANPYQWLKTPNGRCKRFNSQEAAQLRADRLNKEMQCK